MPNRNALQTRLSQVRSLILSLAQEGENIGGIEESIKWGQASFATKSPKSGTPLRIGGNEATGTYSLFVPCSTSIIAQFREHHKEMFDYHGNREIRLSLTAPMPEAKLCLFITAALTYYLD